MKKKTKLKKGNTGLFLASLLTGLIVFMVGNLLLKPKTPCANSGTCKDVPTLQVDNSAVGFFGGRAVIPPKIELAKENAEFSVLGVNIPKGKKRIFVNLATQTLYAYQGNKQIMKTLISSGKWGRTPSGNFNIWSKFRALRMAGGSGADAYDLPNVPHTMFFYGDFALHGAYWHNNFGHEMSHGCVNMRLVDAAELFAWADGPANGQKGTAVSICDEFQEPNLCIQKNPVN